jgi:N4-gp56 family major capsid protein
MATINGTTGSSGSLGGSVGSAGVVQTAYDRLVEFALRSQPLLRSVADKRPARQAMPGSSVVLQKYNDMAQVSSALTETDDPDSIALASPSTVSITLNEYGNSALVTRKLQLFSLADVDPAVANIIAFNMADSIDELAQTALRAGTNVIRPDDNGTTKSVAYNTGAITDIDYNDIITAASVRLGIAKLRANKAVPRKGNMYWTAVHPEVSHDLRAETGAASWRDPHVYSDPSNIWAGEIGAFEGAYFIESPRLYTANDGATATAVSIASATISSGVLTVTSTTHGLVVGNLVTIAGLSAATGGSLAGTYTVLTKADANTYTVFVGTGFSGTVTATSATGTLKTKVYRSYMAGQQALAEAVAEEPHVVIGPVVDKLMRFRPIGWYGVLGFARYREEALVRIESASSITTP